MARLSVGIGEMQHSCSADDVIVALGLGSCVAVVLFDPVTEAVGMVHCMLPTCNSGNPVVDDRPGRYVDAGVPELIRRMGHSPGPRCKLVAAMAGGAAMFQFTGPSSLDIGRHNAEVAERVLSSFGIRILASDVGGSQGRTVSVAVGDPLVTVRSVGNETVLTHMKRRGSTGRSAAA